MGKVVDGEQLEALARRVKDRVDEIGAGPITLANEVGLERNFIRDLIAGKKKSIREENLPKLAAALRWNLDQLLGIKRPEYVAAEILSPAVNIPEIDLRREAGYASGSAHEEAYFEASSPSPQRESIRALWGLPTPFLRDELHLQIGQVHILPVRGDSMADALIDGDRVLIDLTDTDINQGGIFHLLDNLGAPIIRQVELIRSGKPNRIMCTPRNAHYGSFELPLVDPVRIIGRVACKITRL